MSFSGIDTARRRLQVSVPKDVNREGGSFEINIGGFYSHIGGLLQMRFLRPVSIEDSSGCKRTLSTPGATVNVKKIKPTAKFYGKGGQRRVITLENEQASLPLRLTGDGVPTQFPYRHYINLTIISHGGSNIAI